ncbi:cytochrome P450 monooxygenase 2 [Microdochium nivale]|nr:cytochrome P450 monooxygenase 2 [Microdochium nivale]
MWMRRFANAWLVPKCRLVRQQIASATKLVNRVIQERQQDGGNTAIQRVPNAIDWFQEESADIPYDSGRIQITLSTAAIHTTSDLLTETILRLSQEPEFVEELRDEIKSIVSAEGAWTKNDLFKLKTVDSALKEAQRLRPILSAAMMRRVLAPTPIPGTDRVLPKGAQTVVQTHLRFDPDVYEDPQKSNELKVALCHLLIKYNWEVDPEQDASTTGSGAFNMSPRINRFNLTVNTSAKLRFRKRTPEEMGIDLDAIVAGMD